MQKLNFKRNAGLGAIVSLGLACAISPATAAANDFAGNWVNAGRDSDGIASLSISPSGQRINLQASGACQARNCSWGNARGAFYTTGSGRNQARDAGSMTASFNSGGSERFVVIHEARGDQITVDVYTNFGDRSPQSNYVSTTQMRRERQTRYDPRDNGFQGNQGNQNSRDAQWNQQYGRTYSYNDDVYYQQCKQSPDPAGIIAGALIGGLLGHAVSDGRTGATVAGVVFGGIAGAALTQNLTCDDRSYAYRTYYDGLNTGKPNQSYDWRNQGNGNRGTFNVGQYYQDRGGFRCATYSQVIYVQGRQQAASGHACQQPDGTWTIID